MLDDMVDLLLGTGVVVEQDEADLIDRALFIATHHRRLPADTKPAVDSCKGLFQALRQARNPERITAAEAMAASANHEDSPRPWPTERHNPRTAEPPNRRTAVVNHRFRWFHRHSHLPPPDHGLARPSLVH
jgi:hypothetical protein